MPETTYEPVKLFISYSHRDERHLDRLKTHLVGLKHQGLIEEWHDRKIVAGQEWDKAIDEYLKASDVILLLVTPDFMNSQYINEKEIKRAIEKHERDEARVIPVIVRPADWEWAPFACLQVLPRDGRPVTRWTSRDEAWNDVAKGIRAAVEELSSKRRSKGPELDVGGEDQISLGRYREAVESIWSDSELTKQEVEWLDDYADRELGLNTSSISGIECEVMGATKEAVLERQEQAKEEQKKRLDGLYDRARGLHREQEWREVVDVFGQIHAEDPAYPDPEGLLGSAREALRALEQAPGAADLSYSTTPPWEYVDFALEIQEGEELRKYPVAAQSPEGEAHAEMRFPFDERELKDKLRDLEVALLRSGGTRRRLSTREERVVQEFGRALFEALLVGEVRARYKVSLREARRKNRGLRLKLHVRPPELSVLPWEFLYDPDRDYLVLSSTTPLVRYLDLSQPIEQLTVTPPLRILGMVASPQGLPQLDVKHEKRLVEEAVKGLRADGQVELSWLKSQTWRDLQRAMRRGPWHIFHFIGHGGFDPETDEGAIALSNEESRKDLLRATALARLLDDHFPLRLVFLNSCDGARGSESDAFSNTAATLVRGGIPAVVAMQYEITDEAAIEFSRDFYEALSDGLPVDAAVAEARTAVSMKSALEWGTPVLYMRSSNGRIFDVQQTRDREEERRRRLDGLGRRDDLEDQAHSRKGGSSPTKPDILPGEQRSRPDRPPTLPGW